MEHQDSSSDKVMTPRLNYVSTFRNFVWTSECFVASRRSNEPIIDFVYIASLGGRSSSSSSSSSSQSSSSVGVPSVFLGQVAFNPSHSSNGDKTFLLLKSILDKALHMDVLKATAAANANRLRLVYATVTNYSSAHLMTARKLESEVK